MRSQYVRRHHQPFDHVCVDLYTAGQMAHGVFGAPFLREIARLFTPEGTRSFNLWRSPYLTDQVRRLRRELAVMDQVEVDQNVVVHCAWTGGE